MKWNNEIEIAANIESVWHILNDKKYSKKIMPKLVDSVLIEEKPEINTKIYRETYQEGKRQETYNLTLKTIEDSSEAKNQKFHFVIAGTIESTGYFCLSRIDDNTTSFNYSGENKGVNSMGKVMMKLAKVFGNDKESIDFLNRVKYEAENL